MMIYLAIVTLLASTVSLAFSGHYGSNYILTSDIIGPAFYSAFAWEAIVDPTHGRV